MSRGFIVTGTDTGIGKTVFSAALAGALDGYYWKPVQAGLDGETDSDAVRRLSGLPEERILPEAYRLKLPASPHIAAAREGVAIEASRLRLRWRGREQNTPHPAPGNARRRPLPRKLALASMPLQVSASGCGWERVTTLSNIGGEGCHNVPSPLEGEGQGEGEPLAARRLVIEGAGGLLVPFSRDLLQIDQFAFWGLPVILCARTELGTINHSLLSLEALAARRMCVHGVAFIGAASPEVENTIAAFGGVRRLGRLPVVEPLNAAGLAEAFRANFDMRDFAGRVPA